MSAIKRLNYAETLAWNELHNSQRDPKAWRSDIYPAGTEYAICVASTQIQVAIVSLMNQSVVGSMKGFYKVRKAYQTLEATAEAEARYMKSHGNGVLASEMIVAVPSVQSLPAQPLANGGAHPKALSSIEVEDEDEFYDASDTRDNTLSPTELGRNGESKTDGNTREEAPSTLEEQAATHSISLFENPIDNWIHSSTATYYGMLQFMCSLIPPAFTKLFSILGFRGDRDRGLALLWRASEHKRLQRLRRWSDSDKLFQRHDIFA